MSLLPQSKPRKPITPFERLGGERATVDAMVSRFYDLMDADPAYADLRAMHRGDLAPMKEKLADFLVAWMGGPRDWFDKNPGACIMSMHGAMRDLNRAAADQWIACMTHATESIRAQDKELADSMLASMASMCRTMARRAEEKGEPHAH